MITFFTTLKPFTGKNITNQINALRSWKNLPGKVEIIIFDEVLGDSEILKEQEIINIKDVLKYSEDVRLPLVNDMFHKASLVANNPICCYINADIILNDSFYNIVCQLHEKLGDKYLLCGQRYDFDMDEEIIFENNWFEKFFIKHKSLFELHVPHGSDYFVFPRFQYNLDNMPPFSVGRPGWDNWMISNAVLQRDLKVVDLSNSVKVFHQNHEKAYIDDPSVEKETHDNFAYLSMSSSYRFVLKDTNYYLQYGKIKRKTSLYKLLNYRIPNLLKRLRFVH